MPRSPEANDRIRHLTREKLLQAAMDIFIAKGYHAASVDDVARQAGVSKGLLYHYFSGKEGLLEAMVNNRIQEVVEVMEEAEAKETPSGQLRHIVEASLDKVRRKPEVFRFYLHLQTQPESDHVLAGYAAKLVEENARQFKIQCEMFKKLGISDPIMRSIHFSSTLQGIMLMMTTYQKGFPMDEIKAQVIEQFCK